MPSLNTVNDGEPDEMRVEGFVPYSLRPLYLLLAVVLSGGTILILMAWKPSIYLFVTHRKCELDEATVVLLRDTDGDQYTETVIHPTRATGNGSRLSSSPTNSAGMAPPQATASRSSSADSSSASSSSSGALSPSAVNTVIHFYHKKIKYIWRADLRQFLKLRGLESEKCGLLYSLGDGLTSREATLKGRLYGRNAIHIEMKPIWRLTAEEVATPFYVYQTFIVAVWCAQLYFSFSLCVLILSLVSVSLHVWQTRRQTRKLREKVHSESVVRVRRDGKIVEIPSPLIMPGDVIHLDSTAHGGRAHQAAAAAALTMECDAVLVSGSATVDESMLTGECVPISKVHLDEAPSVLFSIEKHKRSVLFCGTAVTHTSRLARAIVLRTGFSTAKGELVRSILFPKEVNVKIRQDFIKCMIAFLTVGLLPGAYLLYIWGSCYEAPTLYTLLTMLDMLTFLVPPLLPAVITSLNAQAQRRLASKGIFCLNPSYIAYSGGLDMVCFDKTGTLTEDSITLAGAVPIAPSVASSPSIAGQFGNTVKDLITLPPEIPLKIILGTCHSLSFLDAELEGDDMEREGFLQIGWEFKEAVPADQYFRGREPERVVGEIGDVTTPWGIVRQFPFDSALQRSTVVVQKGQLLQAADGGQDGNNSESGQEAEAEEFYVNMKGAPEMVLRYCTLTSVPANFAHVLDGFTREGLRVLAVASRKITTATTTTTDPSRDHAGLLDVLLKAKREDLERDLHLRGLLIFRNELKPQTTPTLRALRAAGLRNVMVTGDNILTAISVASKCGLISEREAVVSVHADEDKGEGRIHVSFTYAKLAGLSEKLNLTSPEDGKVEESLLPLMMMRPLSDSSATSGSGGSDRSPYHFALDGKTFELLAAYDDVLFHRVIHKATVLARMLPHQKRQLIDGLQSQGHQVGMVGDGANDVGALRSAHAGVSLSVAESSVASPFTYREKNISCMVALIAEGRGTLACLFGSFKYQVAYCFVLLAASLILAWDGIRISDATYALTDIILNILPPIVMGMSAAVEGLTHLRPPRSIIGLIPLVSLVLFVVVQIFFVWLSREIITTGLDDFVAYNLTRADFVNHSSGPSHTAAAVMNMNMWSYIVAALVFFVGKPFRRPLYTNKPYLVVVLINTAIVLYVTLYPADWTLNVLKFKPLPVSLRLTILSMAVADLIFCYVLERHLIEGILRPALDTALERWRRTKHKYQRIETELAARPNWPPIDRVRRPAMAARRSATADELMLVSKQFTGIPMSGSPGISGGIGGGGGGGGRFSDGNGNLEGVPNVHAQRRPSMPMSEEVPGGVTPTVVFRKASGVIEMDPRPHQDQGNGGGGGGQVHGDGRGGQILFGREPVTQFVTFSDPNKARRSKPPRTT